MTLPMFLVSSPLVLLGDKTLMFSMLSVLTFIYEVIVSAKKYFVVVNLVIELYDDGTLTDVVIIQQLQVKILVFFC